MIHYIFTNQAFLCFAQQTYYIAPKTESPQQTHPKGKLPQKVKNDKSINKSLGKGPKLPVSTLGCQLHSSNRDQILKKRKFFLLSNLSILFQME